MLLKGIKRRYYGVKGYTNGVKLCFLFFRTKFRNQSMLLILIRTSLNFGFKTCKEQISGKITVGYQH